jgi:hypothetical protein
MVSALPDPPAIEMSAAALALRATQTELVSLVILPLKPNYIVFTDENNWK